MLEVLATSRKWESASAAPAASASVATFSSRSMRRAPSNSFDQSDPSAFAAAAPTPLDAPVINTHLSFSDNVILSSCSFHEKLYEFVDPHLFKPVGVFKSAENRVAAFGRKSVLQVIPELSDQQGNAFRPAAAMADGILDLHALSCPAVFKKDLDSIGYRALVRLEILTAIARFFLDHHLFRQSVNAWGLRGAILVMIGGELSPKQADGRHIRQAVCAAP